MNYDRHIIYFGNPYEAIEPDYFEMAKEKYDTYEAMVDWLELTEEDIERFCEDNWWMLKEESYEIGAYYLALITTFEGEITNKFSLEG